MSGENIVRSQALKNTTSAPLRTFSGTAGSTPSGYTIGTQYPALAPFYGVRLVYENYSTSIVTITIAKCASAPTHQNAGSTLTWSNVTFGGASTANIPIATGTGVDTVPGILLSDVIPLISVARTDDVTKLPLLQVRSYCAGPSNGIVVGSTDFATFNANAATGGAQWASNISISDLVTTITSWAPTEAGTWISPASVIYQYSKKSFMLACAGDSLTRGQGSTVNAFGWPKRLETLMQASGTNFGVFNYGWSGQHLIPSMLHAKAIINYIKPTALSFYAWSPNDGAGTQAIMDASWAACLEIIELCRQNNIIPIVCTSGAVSASTADDARIKAQNARVRSLPCAVLDVASVVDDPSNPIQIRPAYNSGDNTHYNDAGYTAIAALASYIVTNLLP